MWRALQGMFTQREPVSLRGIGALQLAVVDRPSRLLHTFELASARPLNTIKLAGTPRDAVLSPDANVRHRIGMHN